MIEGIACDFDRTLFRGDSFIRFLWGVSPVGVARGAAAAFPNPTRDNVKRRLVAAVCRGLPLIALERRATAFAADVLMPGLRGDLLGWLSARASDGADVVIVSASLEVYLRPVAERLGFGVEGTRLEVVDGVATGRIEGENCRGMEKVRRLERRWPSRPDRVWAIGDSAGDREMLGWADHGILVGRDRGPWVPSPAEPI